MATSTTVTSNYAGKAAGEIIGHAFKDGSTLNMGLVTIAPNVNYKHNLRKIQYTDGTIDYTCGFIPSGAIELSNKVIEPKKLMNPFKICKEQFRATWSEDLMGASASNPNAPSDIMEAITMEVLASQAELVDSDIWVGTDVAGHFPGLIPQFTADANVIKDGNGLTAPGAATTESNVLAHIKLALAAVPVALRAKDLVIAVSPDVYQFYWFYLSTQGIINTGNNEQKQVGFGRYMISEVQGLPDNTIVIYEKKNVVFATGLEADFNEVSIVDEDEIGLLTGEVRGKIVYNAGVGYYNSDEIVWLLTTA